MEHAGGADRARAPAGALRRPRRGDLGRRQGRDGARREAARADREHAARQGRRRRDAPAAPRHARHARHRLRQQGGHALRPDHGDRRALGRPHHRQGGRVLRRTRRRSTSTSTRPSSTRCCGPTSACSATRALVLEDLLPLVEPLDTAEWLAQCEEWRRQLPAQVREEGRPARAARARPARRAHGGPRRSSPPTSASTRCGPRSSAARARDRHWITTGGAGTMGFGFPAAIGAQFARPEAGGLGGGRRRRLPDDAVRARHRGRAQASPVKILVINNNYLGMVRQWQELFFENRLSGVDLEGNPDFVKLAEAYGVKGLRITPARRRRPQAASEARAHNDGPVRRRGRGRQGGQRLPDDPGRRADREHDHRAARSTSWRSPVAAPEPSAARRGAAAARRRPHPLALRQQQAGRAGARGARLRAARLQHREPGGEPGRARRLLAHDDHLLGRPRDARADHQAAREADRRRARHRPHRRRLLRDRDRAGEARVAPRPAHRDPADRRALRRQGRRLRPRLADAARLRRQRQARRLHRAARPATASASWCARARS